MSNEIVKRALWATYENRDIQVDLISNDARYTISAGQLTFTRKQLPRENFGSVQYEIGFLHEGKSYKTTREFADKYSYTILNNLNTFFIMKLIEEGSVIPVLALPSIDDLSFRRVELIANAGSFEYSVEHFISYDEMYASETKNIPEQPDGNQKYTYKYQLSNYFAYEMGDSNRALMGRPDFDNEAELFQLSLVIDMDFDSYKRTIQMMDLCLSITDPSYLDKTPRKVEIVEYK